MIKRAIRLWKKPVYRGFCIEEKIDLSAPKTTSIRGNNNNVFKICITGGPCSGKTTGMNYIRQRFSPKYIVYCVPEVATMAVQSGVNIIPSSFSEEDHKKFVENFMRFQLNLEQFYVNIAVEKPKDVIILTDRGTLDGPAFTSETNRHLIYQNEDLNKEKLMDEYDMVIHMVTAANGAEEFYTLENNQARTETPDVARLIDESLIKVWTGSPNHTIVDNQNTNFQDKIDRVYNAIAKYLGISEKLDFVKKYLLTEVLDPEVIPESMEHETFKETTYFLYTKKKDVRSWVKVRQYENGRKGYYYYHRKLAEKEEERIELIRNINLDAFDVYYRMRDKNRRSVAKEITVFVYKNRNLVVETFRHRESKRRVSVLRVSDDRNDHVMPEFPDFLQVDQEISEDPSFFTVNL